jgi:hypothetical protein
MKKLTTTLFIALLSFSAWSQSALKPVVEYLRTAPAYIDGRVAFNGPYSIYDDGTTSVNIVKGKDIFFDVQENNIILYPGKAFKVEYRGLDVEVQEASWNINTGFKVKAIAPADPTGWSNGFVSKKVRETLSDVLSDRMRRANQQLYRLRGMKQVGTTVVIVKEIIRIFNRTDSKGVRSNDLPTYHGEAGLTILPSNNQAFLLGNIRVSLRSRDNFRVGFYYNGDTAGIYPRALDVTSSLGMNLNSGKEYKQNMRIVLQSLEADAQGARMKIKLGASETIQILMTAAEEISWRTGHPVQHCEKCFELAEMPALRLLAEGYFREGLLKQVEYYTPVLKMLNVNPGNIASFKRKETCRVQASHCAHDCRVKIDDDRAMDVCINKCTNVMNSCLKR